MLDMCAKKNATRKEIKKAARPMFKIDNSVKSTPFNNAITNHYKQCVDNV